MENSSVALVDGEMINLKHPVTIYHGTVVVPYNFKEKVLDVVFREPYPARQKRLVISRIKKIVVDSGHGGYDPGTIGRTGLREKDVNLDIAKRLVNLLRAEGVSVVMTRSSDRFISLSSRATIANNSEADLFISIHSNANRVRSLNGLEVYYVATSVNDAKRALVSAKSAPLHLDNASFASRSLDLKATLWDMIYTSSRAESIELARSICLAMRNSLDVRILGVKGARYEVLRDARMPAVLIEVGFLSNYSEERMLKNSYYRQKIAEGIMDGIRDYDRYTSFTQTAKR